MRESLSDTSGNGSQRHKSPVGINSTSSIWSCSNEILKACLVDQQALRFLQAAAEDFAKGAVPESVFKAFMVARMTAMQKPDGGIWGIPTAFGEFPAW